MSLERVTISGADDQVDPEALVALSREFPFVEWGILFSATRVGTPRYPTRSWMWNLQRAAHQSGLLVQRAAHFCGEYARSVLDGGNAYRDVLVEHRFQRIQVNGFKWTPELVRLLGHEDASIEWILQVGSMQLLWEALRVANALPERRISALWDQSGGTGASHDWPYVAGFGLPVNYAGGITVDNVLDTLAQVGSRARPFGIDLESGARTGDQFDLGKARRVLELCAPVIERGRT